MFEQLTHFRRDGSVELIEGDRSETVPAGADLAAASAAFFTRPTLDERRGMRWTEAKAYRDARAHGGCATPLGRMDTTPDSQRKISGAALGALVASQASQPYAIGWTMEDNSVVVHTAEQMIAAGMAVLAHIATCQDAGTEIRAAIFASDAPETVDITVGYP